MRKRKKLLTTVVKKAPVKLNKNKKALVKEEVEKDLVIVNNQINLLVLSISGTTKAEDQYSLRQQLMDMMRFKYSMLIDNSNPSSIDW